MKTSVIYYFVRFQDLTAWACVQGDYDNACFMLGEDCFDGKAGGIPYWAEEHGYQWAKLTYEKDFTIEWHSGLVRCMYQLNIV